MTFFKYNGLRANCRLIFSFVTLSLFVPRVAGAVGIPVVSTGGILSNRDLSSLLANIRTLFPVITSMILAVAFVCGIGFIMRGTLQLHHFGQMQNMMNRNYGLSGPFISIIVGAALIYIPSTTEVFSNTIFGIFSNDIFVGNTGDEANMIVLGGAAGSSNSDGTWSVRNKVKYDESGGRTLLNYVDLGAGVEWLDLMNTVVMFIQMVGFVAFIRGWFIISHSVETGAQQGSFSKGLIHLIGGIISINFIPFIHTIANLVS